MASRLNLSPANVTAGDHVYEGVRIQVRNNVARLFQGREQIAEAPVVAVRTVNGGYRVELYEGVWDVVRVKSDCGCGGRKKNANPGGPNVAQGKG